MGALTYKGYTARIEYDDEEEAFLGHVVNISDVVTFYGESVKDLHREMKTSVDEYLKVCKEMGKSPDKPYSGRFVVRVDPELHKRIDAARHTIGASMNTFIVDVLERAVSKAEGG